MLALERLESRYAPSDLGALLTATPKAAGLQTLYYEHGIVIQQDGYQSAMVQGNTYAVVPPVPAPPAPAPLPDAVAVFITQWTKEQPDGTS